MKRQAWIELLQWYLEAGLSEAITDSPRNRYEEGETPAWRPFSFRQAQQTQDFQKSVNAPVVAGVPERRESAGISEAQVMAQAAATLKDLRAAIKSFEGCALKRSARSTVFADGNPEARVMLIGEAPGAEEDRQGLPFVGRSGQLLDKMLAAIDLDRTSAYITNILPWRPHGNRNPTTEEIELMRPFLERHVELAKPEILLLVGGVAAKSLLRVATGILKLRGIWTCCRIGTQTFPALPTFHPAYLLRRPGDKALAWRDFLSLKRRLDGADEERC